MTTLPSEKKWPADIRVKKVSSNTLNQDMDLFFITGIMNPVQADTLQGKLSVLATFPIDGDRMVISTLVSRQQLVDTLKETRELAKSWRGQYQVLMKEFTRESDEALKG